MYIYIYISATTPLHSLLATKLSIWVLTPELDTALARGILHEMQTLDTDHIAKHGYTTKWEV